MSKTHRGEAKRRARDPQREAHWRRVISGQQHSGKSVRQYCEAQGLAESAFYYWKQELARRDGREPHAPAAARGKGRTADQARRRGPVAAPSLVPVTIGRALTHAAAIEVLLSGGVTVRVAAGCDEATFRMVLAALEAG